QQRFQGLQEELRPINESKSELEKAVTRFAKLYSDAHSDPSAKTLETKIKSEQKRCTDELRELEGLIQKSENERDELRKRHGVSPELCRLAEQLHATPVQQAYAKVAELDQAASIEAKLGPLVQGLIVKDVDQAVNHISKLDPDVTDLWLTTAQDPASSFSSTV